MDTQGAQPAGLAEPQPVSGAALLRDGRAVWIRPIRSADAAALTDFHSRLDARTVHRRFFGMHPVLSGPEAAHFCNVDLEKRFAFVAELDRALVGVARYDLTPGTGEAEVAFVIADAVQGNGLGTLFLESLALVARHRGITEFTAETLASNGPMQEVFRRTGFVSTARMSQGIADVRFPISPSERYLEAIARRDFETVRRVASGSTGGLAVIAESGQRADELHGELSRLGVTAVVSVTIGDGDACDALADVVGSTHPAAVVLALGPLGRPRTFVARARVATRTTPMVAVGIEAEHAAQSGVERAGTPAGAAERAARLLAARQRGEWEPPLTGTLTSSAGVDARRAHDLVRRHSGVEPGLHHLPHRPTTELLSCYGIASGPATGSCGFVAVASDGDGRGLGIELRAGEVRRRLLPLTDVDIGYLAAPALGAGLDPEVVRSRIAGLARLIDDQPQVRRVELGLGHGCDIWLSAPRAETDDPFLRRLPVAGPGSLIEERPAVLSDPVEADLTDGGSLGAVALTQ